MDLLVVAAVVANAVVTALVFRSLERFEIRERERAIGMQSGWRAACSRLEASIEKVDGLLSSPPSISVGQGELLKAYHPDDEEEARHLMTIYRDRGLLPGITGQNEEFEDGRGY